jgi:hypothetical protein
MSTNIYHGFKLPSDSALAAASWVTSLSAGIHDLQRAHLLAAYAKLFAQLVDRSVLSSLTPEGQARLTLHRASSLVQDRVHQRQRQILATHRRDPEVDVEVTLVCRASPMLNAVIGYVAHELSGPVHQLALQSAPAVDWSYANSSDPDENVPGDEWELRAASWHEALRDKVGQPFVFRFESDNISHFADFSDLAPFLPSHQARAARRAEDFLFDAWLREQVEPSGITAQLAVSKYLEFRDMLTDDPQWSSRRDAEVIRLQSILPAALDTWWDAPQLLLHKSTCQE